MGLIEGKAELIADVVPLWYQHEEAHHGATHLKRIGPKARRSQPTPDECTPSEVMHLWHLDRRHYDQNEVDTCQARVEPFNLLLGESCLRKVGIFDIEGYV